MSRRSSTEKQPGFLQSLLNCNIFCCCSRTNNTNVNEKKSSDERTPINGNGNQVTQTIQQSYSGPKPSDEDYSLFNDPDRYNRTDILGGAHPPHGFQQPSSK